MSTPCCLPVHGKAVLADPNSAVTREAISCFHRRKGRGIMKGWSRRRRSWSGRRNFVLDRPKYLPPPPPQLACPGRSTGVTYLQSRPAAGDWHTHTHTHTRARARAHTHTHVHTNIYTYSLLHTHTHARARARTHTHTTCVDSEEKQVYGAAFGPRYWQHKAR